ncbi:HNH endonuclease [Bacillus zanthoxyli]|nr:HNH endonuclease [Bacillus zanthoxyli]
MDEFLLVENLDEVKENVVQFNKDLKHNEEIRRRFFSRFRQWYYIKELDMFAPSKYIGYKNMNALKYNNKDGTGADGRKTEAVLRKWFEKKDAPKLLEELRDRMDIYGKVKINSEIHILKEEIEQFKAGKLFNNSDNKLISNNDKLQFHLKIPAIRLLPMSKDDPEFRGKSINYVQEWFTTKLPYRVYNFKKGMNAEPGTLTLFQYNGAVVAMAVLEEKIFYEDESETGYRGAYNFIPSSIAVFTPITSKEIKNIWRKFKAFNQSLQKLKIENYSMFYNLLLHKNIRYALNEEEDRGEESFQEEIESTVIISSIVVDDKPKEKIERKFAHSPTSKWKRNHIISKKAIILADYQCEYENSHMFFKSFKTGENYVEGHHLIPMEFQEQFQKSLDVEANIVSLCPLCHKKVHHATMEERKKIIETLYFKRRDRLRQCKISVSLQDLFTFYR